MVLLAIFDCPLFDAGRARERVARTNIMKTVSMSPMFLLFFGDLFKVSRGPLLPPYSLYSNYRIGVAGRGAKSFFLERNEDHCIRGIVELGSLAGSDWFRVFPVSAPSTLESQDA